MPTCMTPPIEDEGGGVQFIIPHSIAVPMLLLLSATFFLIIYYIIRYPVQPLLQEGARMQNGDGDVEGGRGDTNEENSSHDVSVSEEHVPRSWPPYAINQVHSSCVKAAGQSSRLTSSLVTQESNLKQNSSLTLIHSYYYLNHYKNTRQSNIKTHEILTQNFEEEKESTEEISPFNSSIPFFSQDNTCSSRHQRKKQNEFLLGMPSSSFQEEQHYIKIGGSISTLCNMGVNSILIEYREQI